MKKIFEEYGGVIHVALAIVALVAVVALLVGGPNGGWIGNAFQGITTKFLDKTTTAMDSVSLSGSDSGRASSSTPELNPSGTIPDGAYYGNLSTGTFYDAMPSSLSAGDVYAYGNYLYLYDASTNSWELASLATTESGITTYVPDYPVTDRNQTSYDDILYSINGAKVSTVGRAVFSACANLTSVEIPGNVTTIGDYVFQNCTSLESIIIPSNAISIGAYAFSGCTSLTSATIPDSIISIGEHAFEKCTGLSSVVIPDGVTSICDMTFNSCTNLTSVVFPAGVTRIGVSAFRDCVNLTSITFGEGSRLMKISNSAFYGCKNLTNATIPAGMTSIEGYAFAECTGLSAFKFDGTTAQWDAIRLGDWWNANVPATKVVCSDGDVALS